MKCCSLSIVLLLGLCFYPRAGIADSEAIQDFCPAANPAEKSIFINGFLCKNPTTVSSVDFKSSDLNHAGNTDNFLQSSVNLVTAADFPGLNTLGLSIARTDMAVGGMVPLHSHPRASEMLFVSTGIVIAGFVDSKGRVFNNYLRAGDVIIFPRGLLHFSLNGGFELATAFSVLNSQNPGSVRVADTLFFNDSEMVERVMRRLVGLSASGIAEIRNGTQVD
ncbi:germin-like protein 11-1 [Aristolochia californica]|uniref:germin-like protein 11-1 n=1 Tax=Aristolochia californica TaxID=171875 RepID=UPI0035DBF6F2